MAEPGSTARIAGISRQGLYLHFKSRTELCIAVARFGDQHYDVDAYLKPVLAATNGRDLLDAVAELHVRHSARVYRIARFIHTRRATDEAMEAAWQDRLAERRAGTRQVAERLKRWGELEPSWTVDTAGDWLAAVATVRVYEDFVLSMGGSVPQLIDITARSYRRSLLV